MIDDRPEPENGNVEKAASTLLRIYAAFTAVAAVLIIAFVVIVLWAVIQFVLHFTG